MNTETAVWKIEPVHARPTYVLFFWQVLEIRSPGGDVFRHFFGYPGRSTEFEISEPIVRFDPDRACGVTAEGIVYMLPHAANNGATDVTEEVVKQLRAARLEKDWE
jgi:hypothetical protein